MNQTELNKANEAICRGEKCPACGAEWHAVEPHVLQHEEGCDYVAASNAEAAERDARDAAADEAQNEMHRNFEGSA